MAKLWPALVQGLQSGAPRDLPSLPSPCATTLGSVNSGRLPVNQLGEEKIINGMHSLVFRFDTVHHTCVKKTKGGV